MLLSVARVSKLFGVEGGVLLNLYTTFPDDFSTEEPLFVKIDSLAVPLFCDRFERRGKTNALATFADIDSARRAEEFIGRELYLEHEDDENDEFYLEDLIGFRVRIGTLKGEITDYYDSEANPLFEVEIGGKTDPGSGGRGVHRRHRFRGPYGEDGTARGTDRTVTRIGGKPVLP